MKQRERMVFDVHNVSQCSQLQGAPPLLKASGKADAAWGLQVRRVTVRCAGGGCVGVRVDCVGVYAAA